MSPRHRTLALGLASALAGSAVLWTNGCTSAPRFQRACLELRPGAPLHVIDQRLLAAGGRHRVDATSAHHWDRRKGWTSRIAVCTVRLDAAGHAARIEYSERNDLL